MTAQSSDLISRIPRHVYEENGLAADHLGKMEVDGLLVDQILACLRSANEQDLSVALRFAACLGARPDFRRVAGARLGSIVALVRQKLGESSGPLKLSALGAFVTYRDFYPDYADEMLSLFHSPDLSVRYEALAQVATFISGKHFRGLLSFREDPTVCQGGTWGNELVYVFRDFALSQAETLVGRSFECGRQFELRDGLKVWWRSWRDFEAWLDRLGWRLSEPA